MRTLFWIYVALISMLYVAGVALGVYGGVPALIAGKSIAGVAAIAGMLLFHSSYQSTRLRFAWRFLSPLVVAEILIEDAIAVRVFARFAADDVWTPLAVGLVVQVMLWAPCIWMNFSYAFRNPVVSIQYAGPEFATSDDEAFDLALRSSTRRRAKGHVFRWDLAVALAIIGTAISLIALYFAVVSYRGSLARPTVGLHLYSVYDSQEFWYDCMSMSPGLVTRDDSNVDFHIPFKVNNDSEFDAEHITIWVRADTPGVELFDRGGANQVASYGGKEWIIISPTDLSPNSGVKCPGVFLRAPKAVREAKLKWKAYASRMLPREGNLCLRF